MTQAASAKPEDSLQAFDLMLLGRAAMFRFNKEDNRKGRGAVEAGGHSFDPNLARAYMNLAGVYEQQVDYGWAPRDQAPWRAGRRRPRRPSSSRRRMPWSKFVQAHWYLRARASLTAFASEIGRAAELVQDSQLMFLVAFNLPG